MLDALEKLQTAYDRSLFVDREVLRFIVALTSKINREICVFISRAGAVISVGIGDSSSVPLQNIDLKRATNKFTGVRCVHTHPNGTGELSDLDISSLKKLRLDCMCAVGVLNGESRDVSVAYSDANEVKTYRYRSVSRLPDEDLLSRITEFEGHITTKPKKEKLKKSAVLVSVAPSDVGADAALKELAGLADTAGLEIVGEVLQIRSKPDKAFCAGQGKVDEIKRLAQVKDADYVIFNNALSGSQLSRLEETLCLDVLDRAMLILDIFSHHAETQEGKLQVELARLKYTLPKLMGQGKALSRIGGGGGSGAYTKGSGETKLETDRRHIRAAIYELSERIDKLKTERDMRRSRREKSGIKTVAIVGYTNAGKSTLMNALSKAGVKEENKLFATLDPVTRRIFVDVNKEYLLTDTVGFIDNLPHELIDAFRSTLDETRYADLLLHVADASSIDAERQFDVVRKVLDELGVGDKPIITVYNKIDMLSPNTDFMPQILVDSTRISAKTGEGIAELKRLIAEKLFL